jgi:hypothetical protein
LFYFARGLVHFGDERMFEWFIGASGAGHDAANSADELNGDGGFCDANQSCLDSIDGQRGSDGVQGGALLGSGLREFCSDCHSYDHNV